MVSMSMTWMSLKPERARFLRISHPKPPAPMTRIFADSRFCLHGSITRMPKETTASIPLKERDPMPESFTIFSTLETHSEAIAISQRILGMGRSSGCPPVENKLTAL